MKTFNLLFERLLMPCNRQWFLALFRVYLALHIIRRLIVAWPYLDILYGPNSFAVGPDAIYSIIPLEHFRDNHVLVVCTLLACAFLMVFGIGGRISVLACYLLTETMQHMNRSFLDGGESMLRFMLLYMIFADSFAHLSLRRSSDVPSHAKFNNCVTNLAVASILLQLCVAYLDAGLSKLSTPVWAGGVGLYYALINNRFQGTSVNLQLAQNTFIVVVANYAAMLWEIFFSVLVWFRRFRLWVLGGGILMHASIFFLMDIRGFSALFVACYMGFFTDQEYSRFFERVQRFYESARSLVLSASQSSKLPL